jgi:hypothetical protein
VIHDLLIMSIGYYSFERRVVGVGRSSFSGKTGAQNHRLVFRYGTTYEERPPEERTLV